jgi:ubiquinone/menaquinone biosynthesis C-methylase UbiE
MRALGPATDAMLALARLAPSAQVLEIGTGTGDVAVIAAARVRSVLATDASPAMVRAAEESAREAGVTNVEVALMEAEELALPDKSFDAVIARLVLMLVRDRARVLAEVHRVLSPGGRFVATTWSALEKNPFHAAVIETARARTAALADAEIVRAFSLSDPEALRSAVLDAGFREVEVQKVAGERPLESVDAEIERYKGMPQVTPLFATLEGAARARAWDEVAERWRAGGKLLPLEVLVVGATRA